jgi:hypothetical protein
MRRVALSALVLLALAPAARADRVHLRNGRVVEGEVREDGDVVVVRTRGGIEARLPRADVLRIEAAATPAQAATARLAALEADDLPGHVGLARDCDRQGLDDLAREVRGRILARWPDEPETRRLLGWVREGDRWITRAEYMEGLGLVQADGGRTWTTPDDAARREDVERARGQAAELRRLLSRASREADVAAVRSDLLAYDDLAAVPVLQEHVTTDSLSIRLLAMSELARRRAASAAPRLAESALEDPKQVARAAALVALAALPEDPRVSAFFVRSLRRDHVFQRVHAVQALAAFPSVNAVPALIMVLRESTTGFGRAHITIETQRAYIQDFELSSGGTGLVTAEVADPVVGTQSEGVSLDTKVVQWERTSVVKTLRRLTGQSFGAEPDAWERWWRESREGFTLPD